MNEEGKVKKEVPPIVIGGEMMFNATDEETGNGRLIISGKNQDGYPISKLVSKWQLSDGVSKALGL